MNPSLQIKLHKMGIKTLHVTAVDEKRSGYAEFLDDDLAETMIKSLEDVEAGRYRRYVSRERHIWITYHILRLAFILEMYCRIGYRKLVK